MISSGSLLQIFPRGVSRRNVLQGQLIKLASPWLVFLALGTIANMARASPILWTLSPTTLVGDCCLPDDFAQRATMSGTFLFDPQTETYLDWRFDISGYTEDVEPLNGMVTPANSSLTFSNSSNLVFTYVSDEVMVSLGFFPPLTSSGAEALVSIGVLADVLHFNSFNANGSGTVLSSVPEPIPGVVVLAVAMIFCVSKRLRVRFRRPAPTNTSEC